MHINMHNTCTSKQECVGVRTSELINERSVFPDDTYSGMNNTLVMETEQTLKFTCQFELQMYPVDRQDCFLLFTIPDLNNEFGVLQKVIYVTYTF